MREAKPEWNDVPAPAVQALEGLLKAKIVGAEIKWGGFAPNATFVATLNDGRQVFIKGTTPWQDTTGQRLLHDEQQFYAMGVLDVSFSPQYLGAVHAEGWNFIVTEFLAGALPTPPWNEAKMDAVFRALKRLHEHGKNHASLAASLKSKEERYKDSNEFEKIYMTDWLDAMAVLSSDPAACRAWFISHRDDFAGFFDYLKTYDQYLGIGHADCRSDNIVITPTGAKLVDWSWAAHTPLAYDVVYFLQIAEYEGAGDSGVLLDRFEKYTGIAFEREAVRAYLGMFTLGYAAWHAKPFAPAMPRLRQTQAKFFETFHNRLVKEMGWAPAPPINHKLLEPKM